MESAIVVEKLIGFMYGILGISIVINPKQWLYFVDEFRTKPHKMYYFAFLLLPLGLAVVLLHNIWVWSPTVIVTIFGWLLIVKASFYLLVPKLSIKLIPTGKFWTKFLVIDGLFITGLSVVILYFAYNN